MVTFKQFTPVQTEEQLQTTHPHLYVATKKPLYKRIAQAMKTSEIWKNQDVNPATLKKILDVADMCDEFFNNLSTEDIYTEQDDTEIVGQTQKIKGLIRAGSVLCQATSEFGDIRIESVSTALQQDADSIDVFRYFTGMGEITFELLASASIASTLGTTPKKLTIKAIKAAMAQHTGKRNAVARLFISNNLRRKIGILNTITGQQRDTFIDTLTPYQVRARLAKLRGHAAERHVAQLLHGKRIPFEPQIKLTVLGSGDIPIPCLGDRRVDLVVPDANNPSILIQCAFYTSNTGSVATKTARETELTKNRIDAYNRQNHTNIKLIGFIDGAGYIDSSMTGALIKTFLVLDDFFQLNTTAKLDHYLP